MKVLSSCGRSGAYVKFGNSVNSWYTYNTLKNNQESFSILEKKLENEIEQKLGSRTENMPLNLKIRFSSQIFLPSYGNFSEMSRI